MIFHPFVTFRSVSDRIFCRTLKWMGNQNNMINMTGGQQNTALLATTMKNNCMNESRELSRFTNNLPFTSRLCVCINFLRVFSTFFKFKLKFDIEWKFYSKYKAKQKFIKKSKFRMACSSFLY